MVSKKLSERHSSSFKFLGIEFAPRNIPWERRLQTISVLIWFVDVIGWPFSSYPLLLITFLILALFQCYGTLALFCAIVIPYLIWLFGFDMKTPVTGLRRSDFIRGWAMWKHFNNYFPIKLIKTTDLDPTKNYLFCSHPHGLMCTGVFGCFATDGNAGLLEQFPEFTVSLTTFNVTFNFPFSRDIALSLGIRSSCRESLNYILSKPEGGNIIVLIPGGAPEALDFCQDSYIIQLEKRKGFIKVALQNGSPLVPVFSFGENRVYNQFHNKQGSLFRRLQDWIQTILFISPVFFYGRGIFQYSLGVLPKRQPINVVVGAPISFVKTANPTQQQIDDLHKEYVKQLTNLFNQYKSQYSTSPTDTLVIT